MSYLILRLCNKPELTYVYNKKTVNVVYDDFEDAVSEVKRLNNIHGDGYSRVVAV